jgi:hypothetical protein
MQLPNYSGDDYLTSFGAMYVELAQSNHTELVPFLLEGVAGNPELNLPDLIHPNASGQKILASNVWPALETRSRKRMAPESFQEDFRLARWRGSRTKPRGMIPSPRTALSIR